MEGALCTSTNAEEFVVVRDKEIPSPLKEGI